MNVIEVISPFLKVMAERFARIEVINRPDVLDCSGALIACNHVGWADSIWIACAVYPRKLHFMSKRELFDARLAKWMLAQMGSFPIDRGRPSPGSIKIAVDLLKHGGLLLMYPTGTRTEEGATFKRGAATIAMHAGVPIVPAFYDGPGVIKSAHVVERPHIRIIFGQPIVVPDARKGRKAATAISDRVQSEIRALGACLEKSRLAKSPKLVA